MRQLPEIEPQQEVIFLFHEAQVQRLDGSWQMEALQLAQHAITLASFLAGQCRVPGALEDGCHIGDGEGLHPG